MTYGLIILTDLKKLSESKRRLFRKKRQQLMNKTSLERIKNGVYLFPFENPEPSENEVRAFEQIEDLIRELNAEATYFVATKVEPEHLAEEPRFENGRLDPSSANVYFVLEPIKVLRK